jgi:hypothetical protein
MILDKESEDVLDIPIVDENCSTVASESITIVKRNIEGDLATSEEEIAAIAIDNPPIFTENNLKNNSNCDFVIAKSNTNDITSTSNPTLEANRKRKKERKRKRLEKGIVSITAADETQGTSEERAEDIISIESESEEDAKSRNDVADYDVIVIDDDEEGEIVESYPEIIVICDDEVSEKFLPRRKKKRLQKFANLQSNIETRQQRGSAPKHLPDCSPRQNKKPRIDLPQDQTVTSLLSRNISVCDSYILFLLTDRIGILENTFSRSRQSELWKCPAIDVLFAFERLLGASLHSQRIFCRLCCRR